MKELTLEANAKVNFTLDVLGKLPNGYHTVRMVMQAVSLHDDVTVQLDGSGKISLRCSLPYLPSDQSNLAWRAAKAFYAAAGIPNPGTAIVIHKRIPVAAGLAGGSTDAAAVLRALDTLHGTGLGDEALCKIGLRLGADIPFCLLGGTMLAEGIGEQLTRLPACPEAWAVLIKPPFSVSTAAIYAAVDAHQPTARPDTDGMLRALACGDLSGICQRLYNVMEAVTGARHRQIGEIRGRLLDCGALGAVMSGSGPTTYGLFAGRDQAESALEALRPDYPEIFLCKIL